MKITICKILDEIDKDSYNIQFFNEFGYNKGIWKGNKPLINKVYFIELEINKVLNWQLDFIKGDSIFNIKTENNICYINGLIECIEEGFVTIRLGDSILCLEVEGEALEVGTFVKFCTDELKLYSLDY